MKILHVLEVLEAVGGTSRKLLYLGKTMGRDWETAIVCLSKSEMDDDFQRLGIRVTTIGDENIRGVICLVELIHSLRPDVVISHFSRALVFVSIAKQFVDFCHVHHEHGPLTLKKPGFRRFVEKMLIRRLPFIVNSNYTKSTYVSRYALDERKVSVVYNPVEPRLSVKPRHMTEERADEIGFLNIGGLVNWRDHSTLIRGMKLLSNRGHRVRLSIVGDGPERTKLEREATALGVCHVVDFKGYQLDVDDLFHDNRFYVSAALEEGFGIATVEAMLAGLPVVLADSGANPEIAKDGEVGFLFKPGDPVDFADCVERLLSATSLDKLRERARSFAEGTFSPTLYAERVATIIREQVRYIQ